MLSRKSRGRGALLAYRGQLQTENRNGLVVSTLTTRAYGSPHLMENTPHIRQSNTNRHNAMDERTTRHAGYQVSQEKRKRIEEVFGGMESIGFLRKLQDRGLKRVGWMLTFASAVYNLVRIRNLIRSALVFKYSSRDRPRKTWCVQLV